MYLKFITQFLKKHNLNIEYDYDFWQHLSVPERFLLPKTVAPNYLFEGSSYGIRYNDSEKANGLCHIYNESYEWIGNMKNDKVRG